MEKATFDFKTRVMVEKIEKARNMFPIEVRHHTLTINKVVFNKAQTLIATCSNDMFVFVYNSITFECVNKFECRAAIKDILFESKHDWIIAATSLGQVALFDPYRLQAEQDRLVFVNPDQRFFAMGLSYGDRFLGVIWNYMFGTPDSGESVNKLVVYSLQTLKEAMEKHKNEDRDEGYAVAEHKRVNAPDRAPYNRLVFFFKENVVFLSGNPGTVHKFDFDVNQFEAVATSKVMNRGINALTFSPHFEFLIVAGNEGVKLLDPENLAVFRSIETKHPVLCGQISAQMYDKTPRYHLFFAGGVPARDQATTSEGGNEIHIYNISREEKLCELAGGFGNVNFISLFKDGSGFVTASEEAISRIYRFDQSYFEDPIFQ